MRYVAVIDGEHYPPVVAAALAGLAAQGHDVCAAVMAGGSEKIDDGAPAELAGIPVVTGDDPRTLLARAIEAHEPEAVLDLSDEPVLDYRRRHELAGVALYFGVTYEGADFRFLPPPRPQLARLPSMAIIGTGKRTGKTAVSGFAARTLKAGGHNPVVVAMGRGGPPEPEVLRGDRIELSARDLLALAEAGKHAASDYVEDALLARVPTVGCRRCGGGLAGGVVQTNVPAGVELAHSLGGDILLLEGSGSAIPPVAADVTGLVVPASIPEEYLAGYMGPYRMLLADFVVVTMCENPFGSPSQVSAITARVAHAFRTSLAGKMRGAIRVVRTVFRPSPTRSIEGAKVFVATTAPEAAGGSIRSHLETEHRCRVTGLSHALADRGRLRSELRDIPTGTEILLCEIKAAAIDVATRFGLQKGLEVVYMDNVVRSIDEVDAAELIEWAAETAVTRFEKLRT